MHRASRIAAVVAAAAACLGLGAAGASAEAPTPVLLQAELLPEPTPGAQLSPVVPDPVVEAPALPLPEVATPTATPERKRRVLPEGKTLRGAIKRALLSERIPAAEGEALLALEARAQAAVRRLSGTRRAELAAVLAHLDDLASVGILTSSRIRIAGLTLKRNLEVWQTRRMPAPRERMTFRDDPVVFQYWPGRGVQHHPLATAGHINALAQPCLSERRTLDRRLAAQARRIGRIVNASGVRRRVGEPQPREERRRVRRLENRLGTPSSRVEGRMRCRPAALRRAVDRLVELGGERHGYLAWEYMFRYGGGWAPWVSGMAQATAAQALARSGRAFEDATLLVAARRALGAFETAPPAGVRLAGGRHFLMYSFDPGLLIYNGFLQSVIGLHDVARLTGSTRARRLYTVAERAARDGLRRHDTGAWTLYSRGGREATLDYHRLVAGFAGGLCDRTERTAWCRAERRFARYLAEPPRIGVRAPDRVRVGRPAQVAFRLSKTSATTLRVWGPKGLVMERRLSAGRGGERISWRPLRSGRYVVRIEATGPEGKRAGVTRTIRSVKPKVKKKKRKRTAATP